MEQYIQPFITVCKHVFKEFLSCEISEGRPYFVETGAAADGDISAIIGLTGEARGAVVISMKTGLVIRLTGILTGASHGGLDDEAVDAVGEIVNIIAGNAKQGLEESFRLVISLPTIVQGKEHRVTWPNGMARIIRIPFRLFENDVFTLSVAIESVGGA